MESWQRFVEHADAATYDRIMRYRKAAKSRRKACTILLSLLAVPVTALLFFLLLIFPNVLVDASQGGILPPHQTLFLTVTSLLLAAGLFWFLRPRKVIFIGSCLSFAFLGFAVFLGMYYINLTIIQFSLHDVWVFILAGIPAFLSALRVFLRLRKPE